MNKYELFIREELIEKFEGYFGHLENIKCLSTYELTTIAQKCNLI